MQDEFRAIPAADLIDPPLVLREVNQRSVEYTELRDSLAKRGFLNSICVRPSMRQVGKFEVVDGRWRTAGARELEIPVPCIVKHGLTDKDVLAMQVIANATRPTTLRSAFARQIRRLLLSQEGMTQAEICQLLNKNPYWIRKMLGIAMLSRSQVYRKAIDRGELSVEAAYFLSRLPKSLWAQYVSEAMVLPLREFKALMMALLRQHRAQIQVGSRKRWDQDVEPQPYLRTLTDYLDEIKNTRSGPLIVVAAGCKTPLDGWICAVKWCIHLDSESVDRQRQRIRRRLRKRLVKRLVKQPKAVSDS